MEVVQGEEMEEGEVGEDGELSDIRYVVTLLRLPHFCSVMTPAWRRVRLARKRRKKEGRKIHLWMGVRCMHRMTELAITTDVARMRDLPHQS